MLARWSNDGCGARANSPRIRADEYGRRHADPERVVSTVYGSNACATLSVTLWIRRGYRRVSPGTATRHIFVTSRERTPSETRTATREHIPAAEFLDDELEADSTDSMSGTAGPDYKCPTCSRRLVEGHIGLTWICWRSSCPTTVVEEVTA